MLAAPSLVVRRGGVGVATFAEHPGLTIALVWRMTSARGREFRMLADEIGVAAASALERCRHKR